MAEDKTYILAAVDAPDPDNWAQLKGIAHLNPQAEILASLTGRPVRFYADKGHAAWEWDWISSSMVQKISAARARNFLRHFDMPLPRIFDGGIAPRTLISHSEHFADYFRFLDVDPVASLRHSELEAQEELVKILLGLPPKSVKVSVGGPMTGLHQLLVRCPEVATRFMEIHAMFGTWGKTKLMQFDDAPRGAVQFNVACDPQGANGVLMGVDCPIYLMPTEVTRVPSIGFQDARCLKAVLPENKGSQMLCQLYELWYEAAVKPRQTMHPEELIYIHDIAAAFSLDSQLRQQIYKVVPVDILSVPHLPRESADWGKVLMKEKVGEVSAGNIFAATGLTDGGAAIYLETLKQVFS